MTFTFPAEVTSWSHVSARVEFSPQGSNIVRRTFEVHDFPISSGLPTTTVPLQSPNSRVRPDGPPVSPLRHHTPSRQLSMQALQISDNVDRPQQSQSHHAHHDDQVSYYNGSPSSHHLNPAFSPQPDNTRGTQQLQGHHDVGDNEVSYFGSPSSRRPQPTGSSQPIPQPVQFVQEPDPPTVESNDDEPEIIGNNFMLADLPDPVWPRGRHNRRGTLPFSPPNPFNYYVVIKGYKIGIFLEEWYVHYLVLVTNVN